MSNVVSLFNDTEKYEERPVVVLADDDPSIRLMIRHVLESEEFDIVEAADGIEAIKAVEKHHPALVLLDDLLEGFPSAAAGQFSQAVFQSFLTLRGHSQCAASQHSVPEELAFTHLPYRALLTVHFELEPLLQELGHARHPPLPRRL